MTVYERIDKALRAHEEHKITFRTLEGINDYCDWAEVYGKITKEEAEKLNERMTKLYQRKMRI